MPRRRRFIVPIIAILIAAVIALLLLSNRLIAHVLATTYDVAIVYRSSDGALVFGSSFTTLTVTDRRSGVGITAKNARITPRWQRLVDGSIAFDFHLTDVAFLQKETDGSAAFGSVSGLVKLPFSNAWRYKEITGRCIISRKGVTLQDCRATGDEIRITLSGTVTPDETITADIALSFYSRIVEKIPEHLLKGVLTKEPDGWRTLTVKLTGNAQAPFIQITGGLFRLTIEEKEA